MNKYNLFLDDERMPKNVTWVQLPLVEWTIVRSYDQFIKIIKDKGLPEFIAFDHDLADEHYVHSINANNGNTSGINYDQLREKTGYECAKWLVEYCREKDLNIPKYVVHSMSIVGKRNIIAYLENYKSWRIKLKSLS